MSGLPHLTPEQADEYAIGAIDLTNATLIALHIDACEPCKELVVTSERVAATLALGAPQRMTPPRLKRRVLRSAGILRPGPLRIAARIAAASAGAAAVFVAIAAFTGMVSVRGQIRDVEAKNAALETKLDDTLGLKVEIAAVTRRLTEEERTSSELRQSAKGNQDLLLAMLSPESDVADVFPVDQSSNAVGRLVWDPEQKKVWFVATNLPARADGEIYQLWVNAAGKYYSLGTFNSDASGFARFETFVPLGLRSYETALVTVERNGSFERSGPSVFVTDLSRLRR